jgi:hypothetical protein
MVNPTALSNVAPVLLPPTVTGPIFAKAAEKSSVMALARKVPLAINAQTNIPVPMDVPIPDWVSEGGAKPASQEGVGVKQMTGKKVALILPVSEEVFLTNPAGVYDQAVSDLPTGIARAFDYAAIVGKSLRTGARRPVLRLPVAGDVDGRSRHGKPGERWHLQRHRHRGWQGRRQELRRHRHRR